MNKVFVVCIWLLVSFIGSSQNETKSINLEKSVVNWKGERIIGASHHGTLKFKSGEVFLDKGIIMGGSFVVDMTTIDPQNLKDKRKPILLAHLKTDDFFGVDAHPTAELKITKVVKKPNGVNDVYANLTIKGITRPVVFFLTHQSEKALAELTFDRTEFNIRYGSGKFFKGLGDAAIKDNVTIKVELVY